MNSLSIFIRFCFKTIKTTIPPQATGNKFAFHSQEQKYLQANISVRGTPVFLTFLRNPPVRHLFWRLMGPIAVQGQMRFKSSWEIYIPSFEKSQNSSNSFLQ